MSIVMNTGIDSFIALSAAALGTLALIAGGIAIAASVLYRSTLLSQEVATRRILGARRSHIVRMFLSENALGIVTGSAAGGLAMVGAGELRYAWFLLVLLTSAATVAAACGVGGWIAARHAAKTPFSASGLFRTSADTRGHS